MNDSKTIIADTDKTPGMNPIRCSVCGKPFLNVYRNALPGIIFATCCSGHKTSYRDGEPSRKAV